MNDQKLQNIRQAEQVANDILQGIEENVQTIMRDAHSQVVQIIEDAKTEARSHETTLLNEFQKKGETEATSILSALDQELKAIDQHADANESKAVSYLYEQMKVMYGNR